MDDAGFGCFVIEAELDAAIEELRTEAVRLGAAARRLHDCRSVATTDERARLAADRYRLARESKCLLMARARRAAALITLRTYGTRDVPPAD